MSSSGELPQPLPPDVDRGPRLIAMFWSYTAIILVVLSLRFYARYKIRAIGLDDWLMLITVVLFVITTIFVTYLATIGGARHVYYLTPAQTVAALKWSWISQPWGIFLFATGKASVACLTLRFIGPNSLWLKATLYFIMVTIFIINSLGVLFTFVQCNPARALWTPGLKAKCWDPQVQTDFNYFLAAWNIAADIVLALLPTTFISKLNLHRRKKIAVCVLLGLGLIAAIFSGIKVHFLGLLASRADFTWSAFEIQAWTGAEAFVMILCGSIPPIVPLWDRFVSDKLRSMYARKPLRQGYNSMFSSKKKVASYDTSENTELGTVGSWTFEPLPAQSNVTTHNFGGPSDAMAGDISVRTDIDVRTDEHKFV
ncbi:integral membrane protein [Xylaria sp. FL0043]|nr:integral membrane protein [Xylaria sp. FL0043]